MLWSLPKELLCVKSTTVYVGIVRIVLSLEAWLRMCGSDTLFITEITGYHRKESWWLEQVNVNKSAIGS